MLRKALSKHVKRFLTKLEAEKMCSNKSNITLLLITTASFVSFCLTHQVLLSTVKNEAKKLTESQLFYVDFLLVRSMTAFVSAHPNSFA